MIIISLSLALILLNSAFSATQSFDMDEYLSGSIISDFAVADYSVFSSGVGSRAGQNTNGVTADFLRETESRGAAEVSNIYYHYSFEFRSEQDVTMSQIYGVGEMELAKFSEIDYGRLRSGNYAIVSNMVMSFGEYEITVPKVGDILTLNDRNANAEGERMAREFEVIGIVDSYPHHLSARYYVGNSLTIILADDVFLDFFGEVQPMQTNINVSTGNIDLFESWLNEYTENKDLSFISRNTLKAEFDGMRRTYLILGGAMSFILALIGVMNFINAVVASIIARRRELAMLQSVGLTGKQIRSILFYEGICYTVLTAFFTLTVGFGLSFLIVKVMAGQVWFFKQNLTVIPSVLSLVPLLIICAAVPLVCYAKLNRDSLVERLRYTD
jgi:putative ABC transport system permease protein